VGSGIPPEHYEHTIVAVWNDIEAIERVIRRHAGELAAVITEPIMANKGFIPPAGAYLGDLQRICRDNDVLFILDEVITGFRLARGGAQEAFGLDPDMSTFAKAMANGAPIGAFAGRRDVMALLEGGQVRHAGTYNAAPLCLASARATLTELDRDDGAVYQHLEKLGMQLIEGLRATIERAGVPAVVQGMGSMLQIYFTALPEIRTYRDVDRTDQELYSRFAHEMIRRGVFVHPDGLEHVFISAAHTEEEVATILDAADASLRAISA
jgi:glutamate-1-semialdehyde 2,1-aminomutase